MRFIKFSSIVLSLLFIAAFAASAAGPFREFYPNEPKERARDGRRRLKQSEAGQRMLDAINAHGGLRNWYEGRAIAFTYKYDPTEGPTRESHQHVDVLVSRAYHELKQPMEGKFAWDGQQAWATFEADKFPARFWALTPYYFVAVPFVFADPGINLEILDMDGTSYGLDPSTAVKATFGENVGDAPDDYYIVFIDNKTDMVNAVIYIITYEPFFAGKSVDRTPEKLLVYDDYESYGPLKIALTQSFFDTEDNKRAGVAANTTVSKFEYEAEFDEQRLVKPDGAMIDKSMDMVSGE